MKSPNEITPQEQAVLNEHVGQKMRLLGIRAKDPKHPMHNKIQWHPVTGLPCMPDSDDELADLVLAALDEPEVN